MVNKKIFIASISSLLLGISALVSPVKGDMPDAGSAPAPYPKAAVFNHQYEFLGKAPHVDDGIVFKPSPANWKKGRKVSVLWSLTKTEMRKFYKQGVYFRLYIDWNHDGDWDDAGEMVIDSHKGKSKIDKRRNKFREKFVVPCHTQNSPFWARAWVSYGYPSPAFGNISTSFGEIEDYNLIPCENNAIIISRKN
ncbi:MAG: hypothetical protein JETT_2302 [Candidatus Jettenia ecosi]|uniref:GEVED domain-containing protein n=1 Tax=Candidatus Jettenia ecosi TaxID=2494326 RepID=A0A533Q9W3_9BACT|nr:MAG: hypothetical protein JETT_2302 [Candidatus Jettenia ecosi]